MSKRFLAVLFAVSALATPALVCADTLTSVQTQTKHLTAIIAALDAQVNAGGNQTLACALVASQTRVTVNQIFFLAWGSVGALPLGSIPGVSMYAPQGVNEMSIQTPGTWTYTFDFYGANEATTSCSESIIVTP